MQSKIDIDMDDEESVQKGIHFYQIQSVISVLIDLIVLYLIWGYLKLDMPNEFKIIIIAFVFAIPLISLLLRLFKISNLKNRLTELQRKNLTKYHLEKHTLNAQKSMTSSPQKSTIGQLLFNYFKCMYPDLEKLKIQTQNTNQVKPSSNAPMLVRINGKEVEVGPGRAHKQNCGCLGKIFQSLSKHATHQESSLTINGRKVDMDNPNDIQKAMKSCQMIGGIVLLIGIVILFLIFNEGNWTDLDGDILGGLFVGFIWFLLGSVFTFIVPKSLQRRLQELKKQGKFPSKY